MHIPNYFSGEAILIASYLINRMPTWVLKYITPLECLKKTFLESRIQSYLALKKIYCIVFVHITNKFWSKLDLRAEKCVFISYTPNKKCYNPQTKKIHGSMDVSFLENWSYFSKNYLQGEKKREKYKFWDIFFLLPNTILFNSTSSSFFLSFIPKHQLRKNLFKILEIKEILASHWQV